MSARTTALLLIGAAGVALGVHAAGSSPTPVTSVGQLEFQAHCAACHGVSGKGDGPFAVMLLHRAPDLTTYAARNGGAFPRQLAWETIDGRPYGGDDNPSRQMPLFGLDFRADAQEGVEATAFPEWQVSSRIAGLVDYVAGLQAK
jgi:mono/diheme cytochrome c family protein